MLDILVYTCISSLMAKFLRLTILYYLADFVRDLGLPNILPAGTELFHLHLGKLQHLTNQVCVFDFVRDFGLSKILPAGTEHFQLHLGMLWPLTNQVCVWGLELEAEIV